MIVKKEQRLYKKTIYLLTFRTALALLGIGVILLYSGEWRVPDKFRYAYYLLIAVCLTNVVYLFICRRIRKNILLFAAFQVTFDIVLVSGLVFLSGGVNSPFLFFYYASLISAGLLISRRYSLFCASLATVLLALVTISYVFAANKASPQLPFFLTEWLLQVATNLNTVLAYLVAHGVALHLVAYLTGSLTETTFDVELLYGPILENMAQGVIVIDEKNRFVYLNPEARRLFNISAGNAELPVPIRELFPASNRVLRDILLRGEELVTELTLKPPGSGTKAASVAKASDTTDSPLREVELNISKLRDSRGRQIGLIALITDLAPRRRLEEVEKRTMRFKELEEMSLGLAHEIRNPLASIRGCTQQLGRMEPYDEDSSRLADIVCRESDRLDQIIGEFLDMTKARPPLFQRIEIKSLISEVALLLRSREDGRNVEITTNIKRPITFFADPQQIKQLFLNIGINALEALVGSGRINISAKRIGYKQFITGIVKVETAPEDEGLAVEFEDNGIGIPSALKSKIFTPFFTTKSSGTGMGLAIANKIVASHNAAITFESKLTRGTLFKVWLPLNPERRVEKKGLIYYGDRRSSTAHSR